MQEVNDFVPIFIDGEEAVLRGFRVLQAAKHCINHGDSAVSINSVPSLDARVFLSPQEVVQTIQALLSGEEVSGFCFPLGVVHFLSYQPVVGNAQTNKMDVLIADVEGVDDGSCWGCKS
jgi:hypothetical protein